MRVPKVGETIIYRDSKSNAHEVSVLRVEEGCVYFASPWTDFEIYTLLNWQGDADLGWDFVEHIEDPLDAIRKRLDTLEARLQQADSRSKWSKEHGRKTSC